MTPTTLQQLIDAITDDVKTRVSQFQSHQQQNIQNWFGQRTIRHPTHGTTYPEARSYQTDVLIRLSRNQNILLNTARQMGSTQTLLSFAQWKALNHPNQSILFVSPNHTRAKENQQRFLQSVESHAVTKKNIGHTGFANGSEIFWTSPHHTPTEVHVDLLIVDESSCFSHQTSWHTWTCLRGLVKPQGQIAVSGTPYLIDPGLEQAQNGLFWRLWNHPPDNMIPITWSWSALLERDADWAAQRRAEMGNDRFEMEYENRFTCERITQRKRLTP